MTNLNIMTIVKQNDLEEFLFFYELWGKFYNLKLVENEQSLVLSYASRTAFSSAGIFLDEENNPYFSFSNIKTWGGPSKHKNIQGSDITKILRVFENFMDENLVEIELNKKELNDDISVLVSK